MTYEALRDIDPALASLDVWALPTPLDGMAWAVVAALRLVVAVLVTATLNVATLGPYFPPAYWLLVVWLWSVGNAGAASDTKLWSHGEDVAAFSGGRASWLGTAAKVTRLRVRLRAQLAATQLVAGYGGAVALLVVGVLWWWLLTLGAVAAAVVWQTQVRQRWWIDG